MNIPSSLTAGDSAVWHDRHQLLRGTHYDSGAWALAYALRGPSTLELAAVADGAGWSTTVTATQSAGLMTGNYAWFALLTNEDQRITAATGRLYVAPDPLNLPAGYDPATVAERALADAEAALAGFQSSGGKVKRWRILDREQEFHGVSDIMQVLSYWRGRCRNERAATSRKGNGRVVYARFT